MRIGLDFGTSNSSVAWHDGSTTRLLSIDPDARDARVMPTLLYLHREGQRSIGRAALDLFNAANAGREVRLVREKVAVIENTFAEVGRVYTDIYVWIDEREPGRLFKSLKMELPNTQFKGTGVYGRSFSLEQLLAELLMEIRERVERSTGEPVEGMVIGRPVHYSHDPEVDAIAAERMLTACRLADLPDVRLMYEPVGAALSYAEALTTRQTALVFDFGGGTLDTTVLELSPGHHYRVLATGGTPIGGDALDRRIMQQRLLRHFGVDAHARINGRPLPARVGDALLSWQTMSQLLEPAHASLWDVLGKQPGTAGRRYRALECLVKHNYGLPLFESIEAAKVRLSAEEQTQIEFVAEAILINERVQRVEFEAMIAAELRDITQCVDDTLAASGLRPEQVDVVIRTGGSSAMPTIERMLIDRFGERKVRSHRIFTGVAEGLAIAAATGF